MIRKLDKKPDLKEIFNLLYFKDSKRAEICEDLKISLRNYDNRYRRLKRLLDNEMKLLYQEQIMSKEDLNSINRFEKNFAESVSFNEETARTYLEENGVDLDKFIKKGLNHIQAFTKKEEIKNSRSLFFRRVVLGAEIVNSLHMERTFGHVKFMKLMYLCEQVSNMKLSARYVKQAAGPYDARFMHSIDREFIRLKWFDVKVKTQSKFKTYEYVPDNNLLSYKSILEIIIQNKKKIFHGL